MSAILNIISSIFWLVVRWFKIKDDPQNKYEQAKSDNAKAVTSGYADAVNATLDRDLDRLRDK